jgi:LruC domain-containing protein
MNRSTPCCLVALGCLLVAGQSRLVRAQSTTYFPGQGEFGALLFEDQWPSRGDFDFNDLVLRYNYQVHDDGVGNVTSIDASYQLAAMGTLGTQGLALRLPLPATTVVNATATIGSTSYPLVAAPGESELVFLLSNDLRADLCGGVPGFINTDPLVPAVTIAPLNVQIQFPVAAPLPSNESFDLFIHRAGDAGHQVHLPTYYGTDLVDPSLFGTGDDASDPPPGSGGTQWYVTAEGIPWALAFSHPVDHPLYPGLLAVPAETSPIESAYPDFLAWASSGGTLATDWYLHPDPAFLYAPVPEPTSLVIALVGALCLAGWGWQRCR